jgi:hypothetical protein
MVEVACLAAMIFGFECVTIISTLSRTNSAANSGERSKRPSAHRYSIAMVRPSTQPSSCNRRTKAEVHWLWPDGVLEPRNPMVGSFAVCCARVVSGQVTAAPPRSVMNLRRCMYPPLGSRLMRGLRATTLRLPCPLWDQTRRFFRFVTYFCFGPEGRHPSEGAAYLIRATNRRRH